MNNIQVNDFIWKIEGFACEDYCKKIIDFSKNDLLKSDVLGKKKKSRDSFTAFLSSKSHPFLNELDEAVANLCGKPVSNQEDLSVVRYNVNGHYAPHFDFFKEDSDYYKRETKIGGQREFTFILYLNDVEEGGATSFPLLDLQFKPKLGDAILFKNLIDKSPNHISLHAGLPVLKGEKWIAVKWVRENKMT